MVGGGGCELNIIVLARAENEEHHFELPEIFTVAAMHVFFRQ